jgi:hypothetical protein
VTLRIVGGASFPGRVGTVSATWPLATLSFDETRIDVDLRSTILKRLLGWFVRCDPSMSWWSIAWEQVESVDFGRRSVILRLRGQRGCRFVTMRRRRLVPFVDEVARRGISVKPVKTTVGWFLRPT